METLDGWKEPDAYHHFCLRHVRSNFGSKFKSNALKNLCWTIGSTSQRRKYTNAIKGMKDINKEAWRYLHGIDKSKWTLVYDKDNRRWGNLTTNIFESLNHVLHKSRLLPIKVCIHHTIQRDLAQYVKHHEISTGCNIALPPRVWKAFSGRDGRSREHIVLLCDGSEQMYHVESRLQTTEDGGNDYTVKYLNRTCTCEKWKIQRLPCSHAIAVCHMRRENPHSIVDSRFHTSMYWLQYSGYFYHLEHANLWERAS
ncbi:uncharacterized protein LOC143563487 [Bidens hawaiensis]|uniref:uncharacterized protein LOC143563487 n=1 Tax=Bidens hawaiensis TaxID=980011 RepID=UPI004049E7C9